MMIFKTRSARAAALVMFALFAIGAPAPAQVTQVDPDKAIDADLSKPAPAGELQPATTTSAPAIAPQAVPAPAAATPAATAAEPAAPAAQPGNTYKEDDLIGAAEGVFGKGAKGVADMIKDILAKQGEPNAYIVGREAGGAIGIGLRYGSGTLYHKIEGQRPVYWTGPSIGFDAGANAGSTFILVYNLYNTDDLYHRFPAGEGAAYLVGGFNVSYLRWHDIVLVPVRAGAGLRLGVNAGYMKFSKKQTWLPF